MEKSICAQLQHCTIHVQCSCPLKPRDDREQFMHYQQDPIHNVTVLLGSVLCRLDCFGELQRVEVKSVEPGCPDLNPGSTTLTLDSY